MGLSLTRRIGERLIIGDDIIVTVLASKGHHVRLGITAPKQIPIRRDEAKVVSQKEKATLMNDEIGCLLADTTSI